MWRWSRERFKDDGPEDYSNVATAEECWQLQEARRVKEQILYYSFQRKPGPAHMRFKPVKLIVGSGLHSCENKFMLC